MPLRQWLSIKNIQGGSSDSIFCKGLDQRAFVNRWAATDIDQYRVLLHDSEFSVGNQTSSPLGQWQAYRHVVTLRKHFREALAAVEPVDQRIPLGVPGNLPPECKYLHSKCMATGGNRTSDASISDDTHCLPRHHRYIKLFPHSGHLVASHATKIL